MEASDTGAQSPCSRPVPSSWVQEWGTQSPECRRHLLCPCHSPSAVLSPSFFLSSTFALQPWDDLLSPAILYHSWFYWLLFSLHIYMLSSVLKKNNPQTSCWHVHVSPHPSGLQGLLHLSSSCIFLHLLWDRTLLATNIYQTGPSKVSFACYCPSPSKRWSLISLYSIFKQF